MGKIKTSKLDMGEFLRAMQKINVNIFVD